MTRASSLPSIALLFFLLAFSPRAQNLADLNTPENRFEALDRNQDGYISKEEVPRRIPPALFLKADADTDGRVSISEYDRFRHALAAATPAPSATPSELPPPTFPDVRYGPHPANTFDFWMAKTSGPAPCVVYLHGGGFQGGDKGEIRKDFLLGLLTQGMSVASVNYRLVAESPYPAPMHDSARALQFLRFRADRLRIDPARIGATGVSAGAGIALWLAFHDDLSSPTAFDPIARQSTRVRCVAGAGAQTSYDPDELAKVFEIPATDPLLLAFFGMKSADQTTDPQFQRLFKDASPIAHLDRSDPPVFLVYSQIDKSIIPGVPASHYVHHPRFGKRLKEEMDALGVECVIRLGEDYPKGEFGAQSDRDMIEFLRYNLKGGGKK